MMIKRRTFRTRYLGFLLFMIANTSFSQEIQTVYFQEFEHVRDTSLFYTKTKGLLRSIGAKEKIISLEDSDKLIQLAKDLEFPRGIGITYKIKGKLHSLQSKYLIAKECYKTAMRYFEDLEDKKSVAVVHNNLFMIEYWQGNLEKSTYHLLESKKYHQIMQDTLALIGLHNNLGSIYAKLEKYEAAGKAYTECLNLYPKERSTRSKGMIMANLGKAYTYQKKYQKAEEIIKESLAFNKTSGFKEGQRYSYEALADIYIEYKKYAIAQAYNDSAYYLIKDNPKNLRNIIISRRSAKIEMGLNRLGSAEKRLAENRKVIPEINANDMLLSNYLLSAELDSLKGNMSGAIDWLKKHQKLSVERRYATSKKNMEIIKKRHQSEIEQLRKINKEEEKQRANKRNLFLFKIFVFIICSVLLASLSFLFSVIKARKERKQLIADLHYSNQIKNKLFSIISHDLKNEIFSLEASLNLMKNNKMDPNEFKKLVPLLVQRTHQTSILLNNLLNWSKSQMNELKAKPIDFDVNDVITAKFKFFKPKATQKNIKLINSIEVAQIHADKDMIGIVAQNLIANAIKFCEPGDTIKLVSSEKPDFYEIGFVDTGVGIDPLHIDKLFAEDTYTTRGTQNESGTGLGLRICKELIELNHGEIKVESTQGEGTTFYISLPKSAA